MKFILLFILCIVIIPCQSQTIKGINNNRILQTKKVRFGHRYSIKIPNDYLIKSYRGVDYNDYNIIPIDTAIMSPNAGIIMGDWVGCRTNGLDNKFRVDSISSFILKKKVIWIINKLDSDYIAEAYKEGYFCASIEAQKIEDIPVFIRIFESMR